MSIMAWNCQGLGTPLTVQALRATMAQEKPNLVFLCETKNQEMVVQRVRKRLKFQHQFIINPTGMSGGLALFWNEEAGVNIFTATENFIDIQYEDASQKIPFRVTFIYAPATYKERLKVWDDIKLLKPLNRLPWVWIGDFNEILYHWEKVGRRESDNYRM
ncbi:Toprim domain-containing protein [Psidium guajava]|nr:Toprim domain-containing protein [Psidium guajava]